MIIKVILLILRSSNHGYTSIKGVIFDMDGTMTVPILDFKEMRRRVGIPNTADILMYALCFYNNIIIDHIL